MHNVLSSPRAVASGWVALCAAVCPVEVLSAVQTLEITGGSVLGTGEALINPDSAPEFRSDVFNDDNVRAFDEQQRLELPVNVILDTIPDGATTQVVGAGSTVSSHIIVFDPMTMSPLASAIGFAEFDEPVLGVFRTNASINANNDLLGLPTAMYDISNPGLEGSDVVTITGNRVDFDLQTGSPGDYFRVLTGVEQRIGFNECSPGEQTIFASITGGDALTAGGVFRQICEPIGPVGNDNFQTVDLLAFEEQQAVTLIDDLNIDGVNVIPAGATVSSFYVVFDPIPNSGFSVQASIRFPGEVAAVIEDRDPLADSDFLGDASADYLNPAQRGLEAGDGWHITAPDTVTINFSAGSPGDVIRVLVSSSPAELPVNVCEPLDRTLTGAVTGGDAAARGGTFIELCDPIGTVGNDNYQTNDLFAFREAVGAVLTVPLNVDAGPVATLAPGTSLTSYYVAFDPSAQTTLEGSVTFPTPILGVLTSQENLNASDDGNPVDLGNETALYLNPNLRGLEPGTDSVTVDGERLDVVLEASSPGDYLRVLIEAPPAVVPALPAWATLALGTLLLGAVFARRRLGRP